MDRSLDGRDTLLNERLVVERWTAMQVVLSLDAIPQRLELGALENGLPGFDLLPLSSAFLISEFASEFPQQLFFDLR